MKMIMLFTSIRPRECLVRAARHNGQFNPAAIEHPMVPEELCHFIRPVRFCTQR
jgi:hypothetical protein